MGLFEADFAIVGSGIAGLRAALELAPAGKVLILTKDEIAESATSYAQGGIAAALGEDDAIDLHERDTLIAGDGLCNPDAVRLLVEEGPAAVTQLVEWGADFDRSGGRLERTREAAHSRSRILHAHGDSTGREIAETLARRVSAEKSISIRPHTLATDLILRNGVVTGIEALDTGGRAGERLVIGARAVLLATGGLGQAFSDTTNPAVATGDGPAIAHRAGAVLQDMEFVQFHPTVLAVAGAPRFLLSEALRGEGAILLNPAGERFMARYHPDAELAPRDVVARAIETEIRAARDGRPQPVACFLDATHIGRHHLEHRFPRIVSTLRAIGLDLSRQPVPIRPAAHYSMGGIATDLHGRSSLSALYAAGEAACTGVHGANRLASNSLLEGLVFGARAAAAMLSDAPAATRTAAQGPAERPVARSRSSRSRSAAGQVQFSELRRTMWHSAGIIRNGGDLARGLRIVAGLAARFPPALFASASLDDSARAAAPAEADFDAAAPQSLSLAAEWGNLLTVAGAILRCALAREESRGAHFREDFPRRRPDLDGCHSWLAPGAAKVTLQSDRETAHRGRS